MNKNIILILVVVLLGSLFLAPTVSVAWWDTDYDYRKQVSVSHVNVSGSSLINCTHFINVSKELGMQADFDDLRFVDTSGNLMSFEMENYTSDWAFFWVRVPSLSPSGESFEMYYGNNSVSSEEDMTNTWDPSAKFVHHFQNLTDSTIYGNDGVSNLASYSSLGYIDGAWDFSGAFTSHVNCSNDASMRRPANFTFECWYDPDSYSAHTSALVSRVPSSYFLWMKKTTGEIAWAWGTGSSHYFGAGSAGAIGAFNYGVMTYDGVDLRWYKNGSLITTINDPGKGVTTDNCYTYIGGDAYFNEFGFNGTIDESRMWNRTLSADEINQSYQLATNQSSFVTFSGEQSPPCGYRSGDWIINDDVVCEDSTVNVDLGNKIVLNATLTMINSTAIVDRFEFKPSCKLIIASNSGVIIRS